MVRVGLTGGLASGKSAVAMVFAAGGAHVFSADELGRALMQPGQPVYREIVQHFGSQVVANDGQLDRRALAAQAFEHGRLAELNAIVHPAVFRAQAEQMQRVEAEDPDGIAVIESALIFEVARGPEAARETETACGTEMYGDSASNSEANRALSSGDPSPAGWLRRFDKLVLVTAPDELKIARYIARVAAPDASHADREALARDAQARLAAQIPDSEKAPFCDFVIENTSTLVLLRRKAQSVLAALRSSSLSLPATSADRQG